MSHVPTHFKPERVCPVIKAPRNTLYLTPPYPPYCPESIGAAEQLGLEVLRIARALVLELHLRPDQRWDPPPLYQSVITQSPSPQRNILATVTMITGSEHESPLFRLILSDSSRSVTVCEVLHAPYIQHD